MGGLSKEQIIALVTLLLAVPNTVVALFYLWMCVVRRHGRANRKLSSY